MDNDFLITRLVVVEDDGRPPRRPTTTWSCGNDEERMESPNERERERNGRSRGGTDGSSLRSTDKSSICALPRRLLRAFFGALFARAVH